MSNCVRLLIGVLLLWNGWLKPLYADERILSFHSDIEILRSGDLEITETIRVRAEANDIKRGIYRDFPTRYRDRYRNRVQVDFQVLQVLRDGKTEAHHFEKQSNGMRVYIGRKDVVLPKGEYTYSLTYRTNRQVGFFDKHDELYFNVTGNGWKFPIDRAGAAVVLPETVPTQQVELEAYTGTAGSREQDFSAGLNEEGKALFQTTRILPPGQGLTIVVMWPKGHVVEPTVQEKMAYLAKDNRSLLVALAGMLLLATYYVIAWAMVGVDPQKGTIIPRFAPPENVSPAAARYVMRMGYDHTCFAAALIHLAVKGCLTLKEDDGTYVLERSKGQVGGRSKGERILYTNLLGSRKSLRLKQTHHETIGAAIKLFQKNLKAEYAQKCFYTNFKYVVPGILITLLTLMVFVLLSEAGPQAVFLCIWLSFWTMGVAMLLRQVINGWRGVLASSGSGLERTAGIAGTLFITLFATPFIVAEVVVLGMLAHETSIPGMLVVMVMAGLCFMFYHLLKAPTHLGRKLMDELEGFRMYLSVAEQDRLSYMESPEKTPELFEAFLPYALALGVEQEWSEQFSEVVGQAAQEPSRKGGSPRVYRPAWYSGRPLTAAALAGAVGGALAGAIASSSTAPGSSSGGGGGGFSGGGGGGGGGGGW